MRLSSAQDVEVTSDPTVNFFGLVANRMPRDEHLKLLQNGYNFKSPWSHSIGS